MRLWFDLQCGVSDAVLAEDGPSLVEYRMGVNGASNHEVHGADIHVRGERPHMEIVNVGDTGDRQQLAGHLLAIEVFGGSLE